MNCVVVSVLFAVVVNLHQIEGQGHSCQPTKMSINQHRLSVDLEARNLSLTLQNEGRILFKGSLGKSLPVGTETIDCNEPGKEDICLDFGHGDGGLARLSIQALDDTCYAIAWTTNTLNGFRDCFDIDPETKWFGGPEEYYQHFPLNNSNVRDSVPYLPGDMLQDRNKYFGGVAEPYWLSSKGVAVYVPSGKRLEPISKSVMIKKNSQMSVK